VTLPEPVRDTDVRDFENVAGLSLSRIGSCHAGTGLRLKFRGSRLTLHGFDHFQ